MPGTISPSKVKAAGKNLPQKLAITDEEAAKALADSMNSPGMYYSNKFLKTTFIKILDILSDVTVEVTFWVYTEGIDENFAS